MTTRKEQRQKRVVGALLGVHAGDSLGATVEFEPWEAIRQRHPTGVRDIVGGGPFDWSPGHATDDTDLTRAVLLAYRDRVAAEEAAGKGCFISLGKSAGKHMVDWLEGNWPDRRPGSRPRDIGGATLIGLGRFLKSGDPAKAGAGYGQAGNGSLMRCIPTACFESDPERLVEDSMLISGITHDDPRCTVACAAYNTIVRQLIDGDAPGDAVESAVDVARSLERGFNSPVEDAITLGLELSVQEMAEKGPERLPGKGAGYVLESLSIAIAALMDQRSLEDVLVDVVRIGKDTDTNGAIAGGILGARDGVDAIPKRWREKLQFADEFVDIASELNAHFLQ